LTKNYSSRVVRKERWPRRFRRRKLAGAEGKNLEQVGGLERDKPGATWVAAGQDRERLDGSGPKAMSGRRRLQRLRHGATENLEEDEQPRGERIDGTAKPRVGDHGLRARSKALRAR